MLGLYFSGTGNTKYCVEQFLMNFDGNNTAVSIETEDVCKIAGGHDTIIFGHPVCFSNTPKIVHDFIVNNGNIFKGKKIFIIATMGLFSGDGAGCSARLFRKYGAKIIGGLHVQMPDCIGDEKMLKKSLDENKKIVKRAKEKIQISARRFKEGNPTQEGLNIFYHIAGLFGQRLWFYGKSTSYKNKPDINYKKCIVCGLCIKDCPMNNLEKTDGKIVHQAKCTMCYRCVNNCPAQALTILGEKIYEQCYIEKYCN